MKRYKQDCDGIDVVVEDENGDYVSYSEVANIIAMKDEEIIWRRRDMHEWAQTIIAQQKENKKLLADTQRMREALRKMQEDAKRFGVEWVERKAKQAIEQTVQETKELPADQESVRFTKEHLLERRSTIYRKGEIPPIVKRITAAINVQKKWGYFVVLGFDDEHNAVYLLEWGIMEIVPRELQSTTDASPDMVLKALDITYHRLKADFSPNTIWVYIGDKHPCSERNIIEEWTLKKWNVRPVRDWPATPFEMMQLSVALPQHAATPGRPYIGKEYSEIIWFLDSDWIKEELNARLMYPLSQCGFWFPPEVIENGRESYVLRHMLADSRIVHTDCFGDNMVCWKNKEPMRDDIFNCITYAYFGLLLDKEN